MGIGSLAAVFLKRWAANQGYSVATKVASEATRRVLSSGKRGGTLEVQSHLLGEGDDVYQYLENLAWNAAPSRLCVLAVVGELSQISLRFVGGDTHVSTECCAVLGVGGVISADRMHLHVSVADESGEVKGGRLCPGTIVRSNLALEIGVISGPRSARQTGAAVADGSEQ